jgi:hypothetical protein
MSTKQLDLDLITRETAANFAAVNYLPEAKFAKLPEGATRSINGKKYYLKNSRWHRAEDTQGSIQEQIDLLLNRSTDRRSEHANLSRLEYLDKFGIEIALEKKQYSKLQELLEKTKVDAPSKKALPSVTDSVLKNFNQKADELQARLEIAKNAYYEGGRDYKSREATVYFDALGKAEQHFDKLRKRMLNRMPEQEARKIADRLADDEKLASLCVEPIRLLGGKPSTLIGIFKSETWGRSFATPHTIQITKGGVLPTVIAHEIGHHVEKSDHSVAQATSDFLNRRRESSSAYPLTEIVPGSHYQEQEVAYKDDFITPYVGKLYHGQIDTEVFSVGFEHFADSAKMLELRTRDPEHFNLVLDYLRK